MATRADVFEQTLIGVETTKGTAVTTSKRLLCTNVVLNPDEPRPGYRARGSKANTGASAQKEMSVGSYEGPACYNDIVYYLNSLLEAATPASSVWTFAPATFGPDTVKSYSILTGSSEGAEKIAYAMFNSFRMRMNKTEVSVSGDLFGQVMDEAPVVPAEGAITNVIEAIINPKDIEIQLGDDTSSLAVLGDCLEAEFSLGPRYGQKFTLNRSVTSFKSEVEQGIPASLGITLEHNAESKGLVTELRNMEKRFFKIHAVGATIGAGPGTYELEITCPFRFEDREDAGENQGVKAHQFTLVPCYDSTFGGWIEVAITSEVSGL